MTVGIRLFTIKVADYFSGAITPLEGGRSFESAPFYLISGAVSWEMSLGDASALWATVQRIDNRLAHALRKNERPVAEPLFRRRTPDKTAVIVEFGLVAVGDDDLIFFELGGQRVHLGQEAWETLADAFSTFRAAANTIRRANNLAPALQLLPADRWRD